YLKNLLLQSKKTPKNFIRMCDMIFIICRLPLIVVNRNTDVSVMLTNKSQPGVTSIAFLAFFKTLLFENAASNNFFFHALPILTSYFLRKSNNLKTRRYPILNLAPISYQRCQI